MLDLKAVAEAYPQMERFPNGGGCVYRDTLGRFWLLERRTAACVWLTRVGMGDRCAIPMGETRRHAVGAYIEGQAAREGVVVDDDGAQGGRVYLFPADRLLTAPPLMEAVA